jgi:hypothetical protein
MHDDALVDAHKEWLGYVQPVGLLVAAAALVHRGIIPDRNVASLQERLDAITRADMDAEPIVSDFAEFVTSFLGWEHHDLAGASGGPLLPDELAAELIEFAERLTPTYAVPAAENAEGAWQMLIRVEAPGAEFDQAIADDGKHWAVSPHARFERLLRETNIPVGLLTNGKSFRLVYAPKGETSGFATFDLESMLEVSGRPMLSAFHMLLKFERLFGSTEQNLPALLAESRDYQETVSKELAGQVLVALNELLRGFSAADLRTHRTTTVNLVRSDPDHLYSGLLTALLRLVFVLYAEDRDLFPRNEVWEQNYSLGGLFDRLRDDAALYPDTMDDRYGAWAQLVALWRLMSFGAQHNDLKLIARRGQLFDPNRFPFIEGRETVDESPSMPAISDGVVWRILRALMVVDGERLSYRTLDVEQIGSVYQSVMGFTIELTQGRSVAIKAPKRSGAAATIDLDSLLLESPAKRSEWFRQRTDRKLTAKLAAAVDASRTIAELEAALSSVVDARITAKVLPAGVPVLQPTESRRRTGSHYTPRQLTAPIVAETLRPIFERLGTNVTAEEILDLRILDPALGSGAFLVEACRQLADRVTAAWERHGVVPAFPPDEDALLHARRLVAQRCLYGVDRNPMAADLAKLSLWLATLAKDHEFTFLDHAICHGDTLVGLFVNQIEAMDWSASAELPLISTIVREQLQKAEAERAKIQASGSDASESQLKQFLVRAEHHLSNIRLIGDALIYAFFGSKKPRDQERARQKVISAFGFGDSGWPQRLHELVAGLRDTELLLHPFHWELQFPEVFIREAPGFDAIIGNPPYAGKNTLSSSNHANYLTWLQTIHEGSHGNADLVAHFFRRSFQLLRHGGAFGLIGTKTIRQGDTRATGLRWIREHDGIIFAARRRYKWPGQAAAVVVSVVHVAKGFYNGPILLDNKPAAEITAYLFDQGTDDDPSPLAENAGKGFLGTVVLGMGFTFDDTDRKGVASSLSTMKALTADDSRNAERIFPYIGGEEVLGEPSHAHHRYVINFEEMDEDEARRWPELMAIVEERVRPARLRLGNNPDAKRRKEKWWLWGRYTPSLYAAVAPLERVLATFFTSGHHAFTFLPSHMIYANSLIIFAMADYASFAILQSRIHEVWARFFGSSFKDDLRYTISDVFETFPFPKDPSFNVRLDEIGKQYFDHRASTMLQSKEGLTETYNRFNNPHDTQADVERLRELHFALDRVVLEAYGWVDLITRPVFESEWDDENGNAPIRYRWPEEIRDNVLARLLELNREHARKGTTRFASRAAPRTVPDILEHDLGSAEI